MYDTGNELVSSVLTASDKQDQRTVDGLIIQSLSHLRPSPPYDPDPYLTVSIMYLAKIRPQLFASDVSCYRFVLD